MPHVDLAFRLMGTKLPVDHGYPLYAAVSCLVPELHSARETGLHPIRGRYAGDGSLHLTTSSRLVIRLPVDRIPPFLKLAGKLLDVEGHRLRVGVCESRALRPAATLYARLVTIKGFMEADRFLDAAERQLRETHVVAGLRVGQRRTLRVKDKQVVGFEVTALDLGAEDSVRLQEVGLGGRRHMGCGVFVPTRGS